MNDADLKTVLHNPVVGNPVVIKLLEQVLADARAGRINGIAIVRESGGQMMAQCAGALTAGLYFGCDCLKDSIKGQITGGGARGPQIFRPM